ncbi:MAG: hypothetical protein BGO54_00905 [Sphingobacteriales bacterium 46-32]|nr:MAG: hypothetical protein BGO54_00905 [Sphingobacteriales bacterium 46-32]
MGAAFLLNIQLRILHIQLMNKISKTAIVVFMTPAALLLASPVATLVSAFRTLIGILVTGLFCRAKRQLTLIQIAFRKELARLH